MHVLPRSLSVYILISNNKNNMILSLLWDEIVADDMKTFPVKVMKLLIWNVLLKLNSKSYHVVKEKKNYLRRDIENSSRKEFEDFLFFLTISRVNENWRGLARMVEYFGGEELKVGIFLSTVHIQKNSWIDQIWTKFATGSEMVFFSPCIIYKRKVSF